MNTTHTDPTKIDTDGDGLTDGAEVHTHHSDPNKLDTDGDGLSDGAEVQTYHTDPTKQDTDNGGVPDGTEVIAGTNPLNPADDKTTPKQPQRPGRRRAPQQPGGAVRHRPDQPRHRR